MVSPAAQTPLSARLGNGRHDLQDEPPVQFRPHLRAAAADAVDVGRPRRSRRAAPSAWSSVLLRRPRDRPSPSRPRTRKFSHSGVRCAALTPCRSKDRRQRLAAVRFHRQDLRQHLDERARRCRSALSEVPRSNSTPIAPAPTINDRLGLLSVYSASASREVITRTPSTSQTRGCGASCSRCAMRMFFALQTSFVLALGDLDHAGGAARAPCLRCSRPCSSRRGTRCPWPSGAATPRERSMTLAKSNDDLLHAQAIDCRPS